MCIQYTHECGARDQASSVTFDSCVYVHVRTCAHPVHVHAVKVRGWFQESSTVALHLIFPLNLEFYQLAILADQQALGVLQSPHLTMSAGGLQTCTALPGFYMGTRHPNSGLHVCANVLSTEPSPHLFSCLLFTNQILVFDVLIVCGSVTRICTGDWVLSIHLTTQLHPWTLVLFLMSKRQWFLNSVCNPTQSLNHRKRG